MPDQEKIQNENEEPRTLTLEERWQMDEEMQKEYGSNYQLFTPQCRNCRFAKEGTTESCQKYEEVLFPPGTRVYLRSMQLLNSVVVASRGKIAAHVMMHYDPADAERILQTVLPDDWNEVYINVSVPVFQGEIR